jgi:hypothetical protein
MDDKDALGKERDLREQEREAREREEHERRPDTGGEGADRPAPPGPESQQPRG